ncbi:hypothetical protein AMTR_s00036p00151620, partial [Amborella trichopoda]
MGVRRSRRVGLKRWKRRVHGTLLEKMGFRMGWKRRVHEMLLEKMDVGIQVVYVVSAEGNETVAVTGSPGEGKETVAVIGFHGLLLLDGTTEQLKSLEAAS